MTPLDNLDRGDAADQPNASPYNKDKFWWSVDTQELSISDGTTWAVIASAGGGGVDPMLFDQIANINTANYPDGDLISTSGVNSHPEMLFGFDGSQWEQLAPPVVEPGVIVRQTAPQSIPDGVLTTIEWDEAVFDHISMWGAGNPGSLNIPSAGFAFDQWEGIWEVNCAVTFGTPSVGNDYVLQLLDNSLNVLYEHRDFGANNGQHDIVLPSLSLDITGGVQFQIMHNEGAPLDTLASPTSFQTTASLIRKGQKQRITRP